MMLKIELYSKNAFRLRKPLQYWSTWSYQNRLVVNTPSQVLYWVFSATVYVISIQVLISLFMEIICSVLNCVISQVQTIWAVQNFATLLQVINSTVPLRKTECQQLIDDIHKHFRHLHGLLQIRYSSTLTCTSQFSLTTACLNV